MAQGSLNAYLVKNSLYACAAGDCNNLVLRAPEAITSRLTLAGEAPKPSVEEMHNMIGSYVMIAHVHDSGHFVLITGATSDSSVFAVNGRKGTCFSWDSFPQIHSTIPPLTHTRTFLISFLIGLSHLSHKFPSQHRCTSSVTRYNLRRPEEIAYLL